MANRTTRRKEKIKTNKNQVIVQDEKMPNVIRTLAIVLLIFLAFYGVTVLITSLSRSKSNDNNDSTDNTPVEIQYDEILAGETFNVNRSEYYVLFFDFNSNASKSINAYVSTFKTNHPTDKLYTVDLSKGFNKSYLSDVSNSSTQTVADLKVKDATLIKISNGANVRYLEGKEAIKEALK
jgi:hypothetical protein